MSCQLPPSASLSASLPLYIFHNMDCNTSAGTKGAFKMQLEALNFALSPVFPVPMSHWAHWVNEEDGKYLKRLVQTFPPKIRWMCTRLHQSQPCHSCSLYLATRLPHLKVLLLDLCMSYLSFYFPLLLIICIPPLAYSLVSLALTPFFMNFCSCCSHLLVFGTAVHSTSVFVNSP